jgi:hypothetical protein
MSNPVTKLKRLAEELVRTSNTNGIGGQVGYDLAQRNLCSFVLNNIDEFTVPEKSRIDVRQVTLENYTSRYGLDSDLAHKLNDLLTELRKDHPGARIINTMLVSGSSIFKQRDHVYQVVVEYPHG